MRQVGVIAVILDNPSSCTGFNEIVGSFRHILKGRVGIPFEEQNLATVTLVVEGESEEILALGKKLQDLENATVGTTMKQK